VICNEPWYSWGLDVSPGARIDDGKLDLVVFGDSKWRVLREMIVAAVDRRRAAGARRYRGTRIVLSATRELPVHADGVFVGNLPQTFTIRPQALKVYAPLELDSAGQTRLSYVVDKLVQVRLHKPEAM
jgi:diacylglycerol kinase (ATP)